MRKVKIISDGTVEGRMDEVKNSEPGSEELVPTPAPDDEMHAAVNEGVTLLVPLLDKVARGMFLSSRNLSEGTTDMRAATIAMASLTATFLGRLQVMLGERGPGDIVEDYMLVILPMLAKISPYVVNVGESQAFEEFLAKEMSVPEGATRQ